MSIPGKFGFGTMSLTWTPTPAPLEQALETMHYSASKYGVRFFNGGEFYGPDLNNILILAEFWKAYHKEFPDLTISIKGGCDLKTLAPDGSKPSIKRSVDNILKFFPREMNPRPKLIFEMARVDKTVPYDETIGFIKTHVDAGEIDGISLSEVGIDSIRKALSVSPIQFVELELSLICQDILDNGILRELSEQNITVVAYSPLGRGFLTERTANDFDSFYKLCRREGDVRGMIDKFSEKNYWGNTKFAAKLQEFAHKKNTTLEVLALSWILALSENTDLYGIKKIAKVVPIPSGSTPEKVDANLGLVVDLTHGDLEEIAQIAKNYPIQGYRYNAHHKAFEFA